ncbi:hypothetical protein GJ496_007501 [Pomphorhynchus laevis]|nr:hypothetical protein GJ496_007501 [Pomphorhynchus laevis]
MKTACLSGEKNVAPIYAMSLCATVKLTGIHLSLDAFYGASWNDTWSGRNHAREPKFRTTYQDRMAYFANCFFGMPETYTVGQEIISRANNNEAWVDITYCDDDIILKSSMHKGWFVSTGYTTAVLNALF